MPRQNGTKTTEEQPHDGPVKHRDDSAAHRALARLPVVRVILEQLRDLHILPDQSVLPDLHAINGAIRACALVSPVWLVAAREILFAQLAFTRGESVRKWLEVGGDGPCEYATRDIQLYDQYPFKPATDERETDAKWSYADLDQLLSKVRGLRSLKVLFLWQKDLPGDWLTHDNLSTVTTLVLCSAISKPSKPLAMTRLEKLTLVDVCGDRLKRDWGTLCAALSASPGGARVTDLDLHAFPNPEPYLVRLIGVTRSLRHLTLHALRPSPHVWQVYVFAAGCTALETLRVCTMYGGAPEALLCFPTGPPTLIVDELAGTVGHGHEHVRQRALEPCPVGVLIATLARKELGAVRTIALNHVRMTTRDYRPEIYQLIAVKHISLSFNAHVDMTDAERQRLDHLISRSQGDSQPKQSHANVELDAID
ncbi:hypothetical protein JCM3770_007476 [Rhodotorula araucariae]